MVKSNTIFSKSPFIPFEENEKNKENKKISYWLEMLHIQGERIRDDNNRRDAEKLRRDTGKKSSNEYPFGKDQTMAQSGRNEYARNTATKNEADKQMVNDLVRKSNRRIISISSSFPWNFFPNTIEVEESRVTFKFKQFFSSQSHSVEIKDISNVFIESSMFFATLQVVSRTFIQNDIKIGKLNKSEAVRVQGIIEGLRTFAEHNINTSNYEIDELILKIEEFHANHTTS